MADILVLEAPGLPPAKRALSVCFLTVLSVSCVHPVSTKIRLLRLRARTVLPVSTRTSWCHKSVRTVLPATMRTHRGQRSARVVQRGGTVTWDLPVATATLLRLHMGLGTLAIITMR